MILRRFKTETCEAISIRLNNPNILYAKQNNFDCTKHDINTYS
jgi:hypothetical protein